jgi:DNA-directed RNA polymerase subunit RPC12/RpoP
MLSTAGEGGLILYWPKPTAIHTAMLDRTEFRRKTDDIYRIGFRRSGPLFVLAILLLMAGIAAEQGWLPRAVLPVLTAALFAILIAAFATFTFTGERAAERIGLRCGVCGTKLYGGPRRNAVILNTGRCPRCGAQVLAVDQ